MHNFTEEIKKEITQLPLESKPERLSFLSSFLRTSGRVVSRQNLYGFELVTENEVTAEFLISLIEEEFGLRLTVSDAHFVTMSRKDKLTFECVGEGAQDLLSELCIVDDDGGKFVTLNIDGRLLENDECKTAYLRGAFLGGGSCTLPNEDTVSRTGYHLEIVFENSFIATEFQELLWSYEIMAKTVARKEDAVVYIKSKDVLSDMLAAMGLYKSLEKLGKIIEEKDESNNMNRIANCSASNIDKSVTASVRQIRAIEAISKKLGLESLEGKLLKVAKARLEDKNATMQELAEKLCLTKSCLNHRMRKILAIAEDLGE